MLLIVTRATSGAVLNAFPIAANDSRAAVYAETANTEVYDILEPLGRNLSLTRLRVKAGTAVTQVVTTGGVIETDPTVR